MSRNSRGILSALLCASAMAPAGAAFAQDASTGTTAAAASATDGDAIVVTGTRSANRKAYQSVSPIDVYQADALKQAGESNLSTALTQISPAVSATSFGQDIGALVSSIRIHGLSPDQTLVLVNGKRRHTSAYLYSSGGPTQGSSPTDLDMIPMSAIDHIELLRDGAAAQYGSDAIAGVINIILKKDNHGGSADLSSGIYEDGDGATYNAAGSLGFKLPNDGFLDVSADIRWSDYTNRSGPDNRFDNAHVDKAFGAPLISRQSVGFNAAMPLGDNIEVYGFGTYSHRYAASYGFARTLTGFYDGTYLPHLMDNENDFSVTGGLRGDGLAGFHWDLSSTYGYDNMHVTQNHSANETIFDETGTSPTSFYLGSYRNEEWTNNLDLTRSVDVGLALPINLALGGEYRRGWYTLESGDYASSYGSGASASPGLPASSAGTHTRDIWAGYGEIDTHLTRAWEVDLAGRVEHNSDIGTNASYKISSRYEISHALALRGTYTTGFRAPTLAQEYYSNLGVSPSAATGTIAANSDAARALGSPGLKAERSKNISAGLVFSPTPTLHFTVDAYQIRIAHRIAAGGTYSGETALAALNAAGYQIPSTVAASAVSATYFANVADTRTRGIDITADWVQDLGDAGAINWSVAAEINRTKVANVQDDVNGDSLMSQMQRGWLEHSQPADKVTFGAKWKKGPVEILAQEIRWGPLQDYMWYTSGDNAFSNSTFVSFHQKTRYTTNLSVSFAVNDGVKFTFGGENIFNKKPARTPDASNLYGVTKYDYDNTQIGINGGFLYAKLSATF